MARGEALTDADREPWLELVRSTAQGLCAEQTGSGRLGAVIACSALKKYYREILRGRSRSSRLLHPDAPLPKSLSTIFVYIRGEREVLMERMEKRTGHFMKVEMLDSQLKTLESPEGEEGVITVSLEDTTEEQVEIVMDRLGRLE